MLWLHDRSTHVRGPSSRLVLLQGCQAWWSLIKEIPHIRFHTSQLSTVVLHMTRTANFTVWQLYHFFYRQTTQIRLNDSFFKNRLNTLFYPGDTYE